MRRTAATTSWGLSIAFSASLALAAQTPVPPAPPPQTPAPQPPAKPGAPPAPAPATPYDQAWNAKLDLESPIRLAVTTKAAVVAGPSSVVAFGLEDGKELWRHPCPDVTALVADDDRVLVGEKDGVHALSPATGDEQWFAPVASPARVVNRGGWVVVSAGSDLAALRATDGSVVWRQVLGPTIDGSPEINGDALFVLLSDGRLARLALTTGDITWSIPLEAGARELLAANDLLYVSLTDGRLMAYRQETGHYEWRYVFSGQSIGPAISDLHRVYLSLRDNSVQALDRSVGNQSWKAPISQRLASAPLLSGIVVLLPGADGDVGLVQQKDGKSIGHIPAPPLPAQSPGAAPRLIALGVGPKDTILRIVAVDEDVVLAAFRRPAADAKKK